MKGPYQFKSEDAFTFAQSIGARTTQKGHELLFEKCPFCGNFTSDKKTFSIDLRTGKYHCFRSKCKASGNMITLAQTFDFSLGRNVDEYYKPRKKYKTYKKREEPIKPDELALSYLEDRGISADIIKKFQITSKDGLIAFTHFDEKEVPRTIKYRIPHPKEKQCKEFFETDCQQVLYGMWLCDPDIKTLVVTEGQIDALSVSEAGIPNAVSVPGGANGFTWVAPCWNWMQNFDKIIIFGDHEKDHITLYDEFRRHWKRKVWCVRPEDYLDCKDANDILRKYGKDQIKKCIENAQQPPIPQVLSMSDVEDVDVAAMEKLRTGLWRVDDALCGGLPFGQLVLITGKAGDGKSTLANQIIINAINEGYKAFMYSGELPNYMLKSWMTFQAAGHRWVKPVKEKRSDGSGFTEYVVDPDAKVKISEWFRDRLWIYDNRLDIDEEEEQLKLIDLIEAVVESKGVRVILLDNLMTALDLEPDTSSSDKYDRQSNLIKKLARAALEHNILIILVAHKKKSAGMDTNDSVSGSADIVNLASIVISYERGGKEDADAPNVRWLKVTKNRLYGTLIDRGIKMDFDESTKRIFEDGNTGEKNRWFNWEDEWFGESDLPFKDE